MRKTYVPARKARDAWLLSLSVGPTGDHKSVVKPIFEVDIAPSAHSSLEAHSRLAAMLRESYFQQANNLRVPLGIYNVSVSRVCDKVIRLCARLEQYFRASTSVTAPNGRDDVIQELTDYIELALYAAAEHVDDIDSIGSAFFARSTSASKKADYRNLQSGIKKHKRWFPRPRMR